MSHPSRPDLQAGTEFAIQDLNGATVDRFIYLREGQWLALQRADSYDLDHPLLMPGAGQLGCLMLWDGVLGYLAMVAKRDEHYVAAGGHAYIPLTRRLSASALAKLLGRTQAEVREQLADFVLLVDDDDAAAH